MSEREEDINSLEPDEITDSINRIERKVSKINIKLHTMRLLLQDLHEKRGIIGSLRQSINLSDEARMAILVACLWGTVSASIMWLFIKVF